MKKLLIIIMILPLMALGQEERGTLMSFTDFTVKMGHAAQFEDGVKKWKKCYLEAGGENSWSFWKRVQGEGDVYSLVGYMENWAEMDEEGDGAGKGCTSIVMNFIMPHVKKTKFSLIRNIPKWSKQSEEDNVKIAWETSFRVKNGKLFNEVVESVTTVIKDVEGETRGYWSYVIGGDEHEADYTIVNFYDSYAALDKDEDSPFEMYEKAKGKKKTDEMRDKWRDAVDDAWSYIWRYKKELSN